MQTTSCWGTYISTVEARLRIEPRSEPSTEPRFGPRSEPRIERRLCLSGDLD